MATATYDKEITALLVVDPYNDFISEGGKLWDRIRGVAEANDCVSSYAASPQCRAPGEASRLLCTASSIPSGRLRDLEVHCAHSEGELGAKELRIRHVGWRGPSRVRAQAGRDRRHGALAFQRLRQHGLGSAAQKVRHPSARRHRTDSPYLHRSDRSLCR